jgi:multiple sugar transport system substrate-binding protein
VKLSFGIWGNDTHKAMYQQMIDKYKTTHPNVSIDITIIPSADYQQKLSVMMATKTAPDVFWLMERAIPQFMNAGQLADLSSFKNAADYNFSDIIPSTLELFQKDGKQYGIPFSTPPNMLYYNKTMFKQKGLETPTELYKEGKWTYDAMLDAAKKLSDPGKGVYGINFIRPEGWATAWIESVITLPWAFGADYFSKDGKSFTLDNKAGQDSLQLLSDMIFKMNVHPKPGDQTTFESGKIGMQQELFSYMGKAKAIKDFEWDIAPLPQGTAGRGTTLGYAGYCVSQFSENKQAALDFAQFLSNPENAATASQFFVPSRKSVLQSDGFLKQGPSPESVKMAVLDQMPSARVRQGFENFQQIDDVMKRDLDLLFTQSKPVPDIIKQMGADVKPLLK